ncbi:MAG: 23S rRNA (adenine(2503)-C(2))-methyltransferase RlmN [Phycisphaeraceae bacterium]|nr:23S rRNA (adenine(2503)-C(2))-methyltransferase RlmN [Phycisphaeraceae bacterium]
MKSDHIFQHTPESLRAWFEARGLPGYRSAQVLEWVYRKGVVDPGAMTNLGTRDREMLREEMAFGSGEVIGSQRATDGTLKLLVEWAEGASLAGRAAGDEAREGRVDGAREGGVGLRVVGDSSRQTECVMIPSEDETRSRRTACISSQVGCPVGCRFCASGLGGLDGNLSAGRIVEQVWLLNEMLRRERGSDEAEEGGAGVTNVVFMGMGEPLANFQSVLHAVRTIAAPWGMGIGARRITISTVGMPRAIERLAEQLELPVTLALSLHAPNDALRRELIPWAEYATIEELLAACSRWFEKTGREITLEYILLGGVNDRAEHARELAGLARTLRANVNLIRYNEVAGLPFARPRTQDVRDFQGILRQRGVNAHIRASRGRDIAAACGQLRHEGVAQRGG